MLSAGEYGRSGNAISAMGGDRQQRNFVGCACDREPELSTGHALRRRCSDAEKVLLSTGKMATE
jgi:hypothetical protein